MADYTYCDNQKFPSVGDYIHCREVLRADYDKRLQAALRNRAGEPFVSEYWNTPQPSLFPPPLSSEPPSPPPSSLPPKPEEVYLVDIDFNSQTTWIAIATLAVLLIHPLMLIGRRWKSLIPDVPFVGIMCGLFVLVPNSLVLVYIATRVDFNYLKAHYEHLGHPPLYGEFPPLTVILYGWLGSACLELTLVILARYSTRLGASSTWHLVSMYVHVMDRYCCIFYWKNLTCLCRIVTGIVCNTIKMIICPDDYTKQIYLSSAYYVFNIIHMVIYVWKGKTNRSSPTETATTSWFVTPDWYQQFAIFQVFMLVLEWILALITYHYKTKTKQTNPITINTTASSPVIQEKQD